MELLACPNDGHSPLREADSSDALVCAACGARYATRDGIVDFLHAGLTGDHRDRGLKESELGQRDKEADRYDKMLGLRLLSSLEMPAVLRALGLSRQEVLFEAGCGTGRLTRVLAPRCGKLVAADFSVASLRRCALKDSQSHLIAADVCRPPLQAGVFDAVVSCQCLEHLPPEECARAIAAWRAALKPGGRLVVTAYHHTWWSRLFGRSEGMHGGRIYFRRFTPKLLRETLGSHFHIDRVRAIGWYVLMASARAK